MAKIKGPLLSLTAHGSLGKEITYSKRSSGQQARYQRKQHYPGTNGQIIQRSYFLTASGWWGQMTAVEQDGFNGYTTEDR